MCLVGVIFVKKWLILPPIEDSHWKEKLRRIDFRGAFMLVIAVFSLLIGTDRGSNLSWTAPITLSALGAALVFAIAFFYIEIRVASEPFAPGHIIFSKVLLPCYIVNFFGFASWLAALFFLPLYFQATQGHTASQAGLRVLPAALSSVCGSLGSGIYMKKTGRYYRITLLSAVMLTLALLTLYLSSGPLVTNNWIVVLATMPAAFGVGIAVTTTLIGLSMPFFLYPGNRLMIYSSLERHPPRPSCCDGLLVPFPNLGIYHWYRAHVHSRATVPARSSSQGDRRWT